MEVDEGNSNSSESGENAESLFHSCETFITKFLEETVLKMSVSVITSDPPCKDGNARFTTVPCNALSDYV